MPPSALVRSEPAFLIDRASSRHCIQAGCPVQVKTPFLTVFHAHRTAVHPEIAILLYFVRFRPDSLRRCHRPAAHSATSSPSTRCGVQFSTFGFFGSSLQCRGKGPAATKALIQTATGRPSSTPHAQVKTLVGVDESWHAEWYGILNPWMRRSSRT